MNSKSRIKLSLNHQQPDRIPLDIGASGTSGLHVKNVHELRNYLGLKPQKIKAFEPYQMLGWMDEDILTALDIDVQGIPGQKTMFGFENHDWKPWKMDIGLEVLISKDFKYTKDEDGSTLVYPEGDDSVPPSGRMPKNGYFFDSIIRQQAIIEEKLDPKDNLEEFKPIDAEGLNYYQKQIDLFKNSPRSILGSFGGTALGDIALVPGPFMKETKGIRDVTEWYMSTLIRQDYIHSIFEKQTEIALHNLAELFKVVGNELDVIFLCGTDFGTQTSTFCSADTYKSLYHPYYKKMNDWIHAHTTWKTFKHSCGAVADFIPLFIESGFDILNPVQISASGMDPKTIKDQFGKDIVFWGGGIDTQQMLPFGKPAEIREQVLNNCEIFSRDGGFIFNTVHNIQGHTPIENIISMLNALREFNGQKPIRKA